jgi:hypothetical protein
MRKRWMIARKTSATPLTRKNHQENVSKLLAPFGREVAP